MGGFETASKKSVFLGCDDTGIHLTIKTQQIIPANKAFSY
jgi:hypothetical protein